jgi:putative transposase
MVYNPDLHHRRSIRIKGYDYGQSGFYFITICTCKRERLFGKIRNGKMELNKWGNLVHNEWLKTAEIRPNIKLDAFVVMPDHIHGIIQIIDNDNGHHRGTMHRAPMHEQFGKPTSNTIPTIIRSFKSTVTKQINMLRKTPGLPVWQRNYYIHIIHNKKSHHKICQYIKNNPSQWSE